MKHEQTLSIIKPDAVQKAVIGAIYSRFEQAGLRIVAAKMFRFSRASAAAFYAEHDGKPFFEPLIQFMTSGPVMVQVLSGEQAIQKHRVLMGATDPAQAEAGTIRRDYATSIDANAVHGSDSAQSAQREIDFLFSSDSILDEDQTDSVA